MSEESGNGNSLRREGVTPSTTPAADEVEEQFGNLYIDPNSKAQTDDREARDSDQTPQPKKDTTKRKDSETVKRQLEFGDRDDGDDGEFGDGEWLQDHPWKDERPDRQNLKIAITVAESADYKVLKKWKTGCKVCLQEIYSKLPEFVSEMKGPTCREELERLLHSSLCETLSLNEGGSPHIKEIVQKKAHVQPQDKRSPREQGKTFKAYSLSAKQFQPSQENYWYLDCEYMLKMYLPPPLQCWFKTESGKLIREIKSGKEDKRWVFTPSFRRANIALLDWPQDNDEIVTPESTVRILVVRPSEFEEYVKCCGHTFPVISLPQDEIGAGYSRLWIQKIALRLKLDFIWMIDDSVECFYEYYPKKNPPKGSYKEYRSRPFGNVFKRIENFVKEEKQPPIAAMSPEKQPPIAAMSPEKQPPIAAMSPEKQPPIAAMSPRRFDPRFTLTQPFACKPPQIAVFLNIKELKLKEVCYRPELQVLEDMIFGYECEQSGLKVFMDNRVQLQDRKWEDTGARSPSVQQHQPEADNDK